jgi:hypothetical protein
MIALNDAQLKVVMAAAADVPVEKWSQFLEPIAAMLRLCGRGHFDDADLTDAVSRALNGLIQQPAALNSRMTQLYLSGKLSGLPCREGLSTGRSGRI